MRLFVAGSAVSGPLLWTTAGTMRHPCPMLGLVRMKRALQLAIAQHGILLRRQLLDLGFSERTVHRRAQDGLWSAHGHRVLVLAGTPDDLATRSRVAALRTPGSILTGPSSAALRPSGPWQASMLGSTPWLICPGRRRVPGRLISHPDPAIQHLGLWNVAAPSVAVVDMLRFLDLDVAMSLGHRALQTGVVSVTGLQQAVVELRGRGGLRQLRDITSALATGSHSLAEQRLVRLLSNAAVVGWLANLRVRIGRTTVVIDIAFPAAMLAVEVDGRAWHTDARTFVADRRRQNLLVNAGWTVLRYTWADLIERPGEVLAEIRVALARTA